MSAFTPLLMVAALAAAGTPQGIEPRPDLNDPARVETDGWLGFEIPALPGTRSPCCWQGRWHEREPIGCELDGRHHSYGTRDDSPETETLRVLARRQDGQVDRLLVVGDACPVDTGNHRVTWLPRVIPPADLEWLANQVRTDRPQVADPALHALALHAADGAGQRLHRFAREENGERAGQAIFWLGEARGEQGLSALESLLETLPQGQRRVRINFALSQNDSPGAAERLLRLSREDADDEQRADALFWLSESHHPQAAARMREAVSHDASRKVRERAVFALANLDTEEASETLAELARGSDKSVRGEALFWLAQSDPGRAEPLIMELLQESADRAFTERLVFALSQLPSERANARLLELARDPDQSRDTRRQALFWLAQSDDDEAVDELVRLLTGEP